MQKRLYIILFVIIVILSSTFFIKETFARYTSETTSETPVGIAIPIFVDNVSELSLPVTELVPGDTRTFDFYVTNEDNTSTISYVDLNYYIIMEKSTNLPVTFTLSKNGDPTNIFNESNVSPTYVMGHTNRQIDNYTLTINWDINYKDYNYNNVLDYITIKVHAEQKME